jgi:hypothetical protein
MFFSVKVVGISSSIQIGTIMVYIGSHVQPSQGAQALSRHAVSSSTLDAVEPKKLGMGSG